MSEQDYSFCVLVIEDEKPWADFITSALIKRGLRYKVASTIKEAYQLITKHRFHFISCDMRMPFERYEKADVLFGVKMTKEIHDSGYLAFMKIYSSQAGSHIEQTLPSHARDIFQLSGAIGTEVYRKSVTNKSHGDDLTPEDYAEKIKDVLFDEDSNLHYLKAARPYLPPPLASICNKLIDSWHNVSNVDNHWLAWIGLYQALLYMTWAQLLAVLDVNDKFPTKNTGLRNIDAERINDIEGWLLAARNVPGCLSPWKSFFMDPKDTGIGLTRENGNLGDGLLETLQNWRHFRNDKFHGAIDEHEKQNFHKTMFSQCMRLTDLLAFWCSHPLISRFELLDGAGNAKAWKIKTIDESTEIQIEDAPQSLPGHVYTQWKKHDNGKVELLDLWPWIHEEPEPGSPHKTLYCFSHAAKGPGEQYKFYRRNFVTGNTKEFNPDKKQREKYEELVGR